MLFLQCNFNKLIKTPYTHTHTRLGLINFLKGLSQEFLGWQFYFRELSSSFLPFAAFVRLLYSKSTTCSISWAARYFSSTNFLSLIVDSHIVNNSYLYHEGNKTVDLLPFVPAKFCRSRLINGTTATFCRSRLINGTRSIYESRSAKSGSRSIYESRSAKFGRHKG